jgi:hypothetical protein
MLLSLPQHPAIISYPIPSCEMLGLPMSTTLALGPSTSPAEYCFNGGVDLGGVLELKEHPLDDDTAANNADNASDTAVVEVLGEDPITFQKKGSFYSDKKGTYYMLKWANFAGFDMWCQVKEANNSIELWKSTK